MLKVAYLTAIPECMESPADLFSSADTLQRTVTALACETLVHAPEGDICEEILVEEFSNSLMAQKRRESDENKCTFWTLPHTTQTLHRQYLAESLRLQLETLLRSLLSKHEKILQMASTLRVRRAEK